MAWYYNSIRIYVQSLEGSGKQIMPRLQPLTSATVIQIFGHESPIWKVQCKVVGDSNLNSLKGLIDNATAYYLTGNNSFSKSLLLANISYKRDEMVYQTIDTTQDCETPVYTVTLELYEEE